MVTLAPPDSELETMVFRLLDRLISTTRGEYYSTCPTRVQHECRLEGCVDGYDTVPDYEARDQALKAILALPKEGVLPILLNVSSPVSPGESSIWEYVPLWVDKWKLDSNFILSVLLEPRNSPNVRVNALRFLLPNTLPPDQRYSTYQSLASIACDPEFPHAGRLLALGALDTCYISAQGDKDIEYLLFCLSTSKAPDDIRFKSLKTLNQIGVSTSHLKKSIRSLSYPWSRKYSWNRDMKSIGLHISGFPSRIERAALGVATALSAYGIISSQQPYESFPFSQAFSNPTQPMILTSLLVGVIAYCGSDFIKGKNQQR